MTNEEIQERRTVLLTSLRKLKTALDIARDAYHEAYAQYNIVNEEFQQLDRLLAEQHVTKVPKGKSGLKTERIKKDPEAFIKSLSSEQKHKLLEELGLLTS